MRALYNNADVIVLDEPTTALSLTETQKVFRFVDAVKNSGRTVIFIGHNIYHVYDIADRFFVIDRGPAAFEGEKAAFTGADHLIHMMHHSWPKPDGQMWRACEKPPEEALDDRHFPKCSQARFH